MKAYDPYKNVKEFIYICSAGDTAETVSDHYGVPVEKIRKDNPAAENLYAGDEIYIANGNGVRYRVRAGDGDEKIAEIFGADPGEISEYNGCRAFYPGQILYFPKKT